MGWMFWQHRRGCRLTGARQSSAPMDSRIQPCLHQTVHFPVNADRIAAENVKSGRSPALGLSKLNRPAGSRSASRFLQRRRPAGWWPAIFSRAKMRRPSRSVRRADRAVGAGDLCEDREIGHLEDCSRQPPHHGGSLGDPSGATQVSPSCVGVSDRGRFPT